MVLEDSIDTYYSMWWLLWKADHPCSHLDCIFQAELCFRRNYTDSQQTGRWGVKKRYNQYSGIQPACAKQVSIQIHDDFWTKSLKLVEVFYVIAKY